MSTAIVLIPREPECVSVADRADQGADFVSSKDNAEITFPGGKHRPVHNRPLAHGFVQASHSDPPGDEAGGHLKGQKMSGEQNDAPPARVPGKSEMLLPCHSTRYPVHRWASVPG